MTSTAQTSIDAERYGPWAVIAGGSEGVGAAFATQLAGAGLNLVLLARKPEPLAETAARCRELGVEVRTLSVDLTSNAAVPAIRKATDDLEVGLLVYNAGANTYGHEFVTGDLTRFQQVIDLNITAQLALVQLFGGPMRERRRGGLLLVGSMAGFLGAEQISVYAAVKSFCRTFAEGLWLELREYDVDVLEFVLGMTRTPAMERAGLRMDLPGLEVAEPADVAAQALAQLAQGPVQAARGQDSRIGGHVGEARRSMLLKAQAAARRFLPPADEADRA